ncbi:MAG: sugar transferase [Clostridia bacterium]|nr:sugar transferase [Clostridia bacterium]
MKKRIMSLNMIKIFHTLLVICPFLLCWFLYYEPNTLTATSRQVSALVITVYIVIYYTLCLKLDGFRASVVGITEMIYSQIISAALADVCAALGIWMLSIWLPNLFPGFLCFLGQCVIIFILCQLEYRSYYKHHKPWRTLVVYDARQGVEKLISAYGLEQRYEIRKVIPVEEILNHLDVLDEIETVFLSGIHSRERNNILKECIYRDIQVYIIPRVGDVLMSGAEQMHMLHLPFLRSKRYRPLSEYRVLKRILDIAFSGVALILFSPVMLVTAIAVKMDGGPAFYKQTRLTIGGKEFKILKFRSMCVDAEKMSGAVLSSGKDDPRITKVGRIIRACRVDELPQLLNIFAGDMSIVGPRPERPEIAAVYEKQLPEFSLRLQAKAGLTGYAQVYGKYNTTPYDKLLMDLMYISGASLFMDLQIALETIRILFDKRSTEGLGDESVSLVYSERTEPRKDNTQSHHSDK